MQEDQARLQDLSNARHHPLLSPLQIPFIEKEEEFFGAGKGKEKKKNDERVKQSTGLRCIYLFHADYKSLHQQDSKWGAMGGGGSGQEWGWSRRGVSA